LKISATTSSDLQIANALGYPYARPDHSYMLTGSTISEMPADFWPQGRFPVIACGSNASPDQLIRKFNGIETDPIYVTKADLPGFVCCYSAHITGYGSIPATFATAPGTQTDCHITWLTEAQLERMHKTESVGVNYRFSKLTGTGLRCHTRGPVNEAYAYISRSGHLEIEGSPIPVSALSTTPPASGALDQEDLQRKICSLLFPDVSLNDFILDNIRNEKLRRDRTAQLGQYAKVFSSLCETVILP